MIPLNSEAAALRGLMKVLTETPLRFLEREVEEMTPEEAADVWGHIEPFFRGVCARASATRVGMKWNMLARKMSLIRSKAEGEK